MPVPASRTNSVPGRFSTSTQEVLPPYRAVALERPASRACPRSRLSLGFGRPEDSRGAKQPVPSSDQRKGGALDPTVDLVPAANPQRRVARLALSECDHQWPVLRLEDIALLVREHK